MDADRRAAGARPGTLAGFVYALLPALALLWIRERDAHGLDLLFWTFIVTWSTDIGAYFAGRRFGRRKLAPTISPDKTVEGLFGGIAAATLLGGAWVFATGLGKPLLFARAALRDRGAGRATFRKRDEAPGGSEGLRDWLPGHGGVLDRLDGLVPVAVLTAAAQLLGLT